MKAFVKLLPTSLMARATLRANEYGWAVADIPAVIDAVAAADLVSIGGQLQLRIPDGGTCECYWIEVDTTDVGKGLPWSERVAATANAADVQFQNLCRDYDFLSEVRSAFPEHVRRFEEAGGDVSAHLCFVWYVAGAD